MASIVGFLVGFWVQLSGFGAGIEVADYLVKAWQTDDGLPQNSVPAITQTPDGFLWAGTFNGLVRFDGQDFEIFTAVNTPGLDSDNINVLATDDRGRLWIGTDAGGLSRFEGGRFTAFHSTNAPGSDRIEALAVVPGGAVWVNTPAGVYQLVDGRFQAPALEGDQAELARVRTLCADGDGQLWIGTSNGLYSIVGNRIERSPNASGPTDVFPGREGRVHAAGGTDGVQTWANGRWTPVPGGEGLSPTSLCEALNGDLWLVLPQRGLVRLGGGRLTELKESHGLRGEGLSTLWVDERDHLWVGSNGGGLHRVSRRWLTGYSRENGLPSDDVVCLLEERPGRVWLGSYQGGVAVWDHGRVETPAGLPGVGEIAYALDRDRAGDIWIGTPTGTLHRWREGAPPESTVFPGEGCRVIYHDRAGGRWLGSKFGGLLHQHAGRTDRYTTTNGLSNDYVTAIVEARDGEVWVGTKRGLNRIGAGGVTTYLRSQGLGADAVHTLYAETNGVLWVGTAGGGLSRIKDGRVATITRRQGLPDDVVAQILEDGRGYFWIGSNVGLFRVGRRQLEECADGVAPYLQGTRVNRDDGIRNPECAGSFQPGCFRAADGRLWFATVGGVVVIDPADLPTRPQPPPVQILRVLADGRPLENPAPGGVHELAPGIGRVDFHYTAVCLSAPEQLRFRFRLTGVDRDWVEAGTDRSASYTHLSPGAYQFTVTAADSESFWNPVVASIGIVVLPAWWQTAAFRLGLGLVLGGSVLGCAVALYRRQLNLRLAAERRRQERRHAAEIAASHVSLEARTRELEDALANVKQLVGLIPICSACKKVRDDRGYWNQVERYIAQHTDARFSHGICPDCLERLYPEITKPPGTGNPPHPEEPSNGG